MIDTDGDLLDPRTGDGLRLVRDLAVVHDLSTSRPPLPVRERLDRMGRRQAEDVGRSVRVQALERLGR